jgi:HEPN domain-containing protein
MKKTTREWVRKAEADYRAARKLFRGNDPLHDRSCFLCQQCAEKYLKALREEAGLAIAKTHILKDLLHSLPPNYAAIRGLGRGLTFLTRFAVGTRYPGDNATRRQVVSAQRWASTVRERTALGLRRSGKPRFYP